MRLGTLRGRSSARCAPVARPTHRRNSSAAMRRKPFPRDPSAVWFRGLDELRRMHGAWFDVAGFGPVQTPSVVWRAQTGLRLRSYGREPARGAVVLVIPAPIKRHYIWDSSPSCSVVGHALACGCDVYLAEWAETPLYWGLDDYVNAIAWCVEQIEGATRRAPHLLSHSLGGTLCALYAARHPLQAASLVLVEAPLRFGRAAGAFAAVLAESPSGSALRDAFGSIPGTVLDLAAVLASPTEFVWDHHLDAFRAAMAGGEAWTKHLLAVRWTLDEAALPGKAFMQIVDSLYREDAFMQERLIVCGRRVAPQHVSVPIAAVVDRRSRVLPAESVLDFVEAVPGVPKLVLCYEGDVGVALQHLGALIGTSAHREIWPRIFGWLQQLDSSR